MGTTRQRFTDRRAKEHVWNSNAGPMSVTGCDPTVTPSAAMREFPTAPKTNADVYKRHRRERSPQPADHDCESRAHGHLAPAEQQFGGRMESSTPAPDARVARSFRGRRQFDPLIPLASCTAMGFAVGTVIRRNARLLTPDLPAGHQAVGGALDPLPTTVEHVCVNHRRRDIAVPKKLLDGPNIIPPISLVPTLVGRGGRLPRGRVPSRPRSHGRPPPDRWRRESADRSPDSRRQRESRPREW